jgi:predicted enzyme related to lactoylglutathione lyase
MSKNPIVHWELMGPDGDAMKTFYSTIFDWKFQSPPGFENYHMTDAEDTAVGGAVGQGMADMPAYAAIYVQVENIDSTLEEVEKAGGKTVVPRTVIPDTVVFGMFHDPAGNLVALVEED